jgi:hypothetical protein
MLCLVNLPFVIGLSTMTLMRKTITPFCLCGIFMLGLFSILTVVGEF